MFDALLSALQTDRFPVDRVSSVRSPPSRGMESQLAGENSNPNMLDLLFRTADQAGRGRFLQIAATSAL